MKRITFIILTLILCASVVGAQDVKPGIVSVGSYLINWAANGEDTDFEGFTVGGTYAFSSSMAVRGGFYSTENETLELIEINGLEAQFLLGSNLNAEGFKIYGLGGFFRETPKVGSIESDVDYSGAMIGGGLGYNWKSVALDFSLAWRQNDDYMDEDNDAKSDDPDIDMMSGSLSIGLRF